MQIMNLRPGTAGGRVLVRFDVDFVDTGIRMYGVEIRRNASGELRAFPPALGDRKSATFSPALADTIISTVWRQMPYGRNS